MADLYQISVDSLAEKLNDIYKTNATGFAVDISNQKMVADVSKKISKKFGKIDGLTNNVVNPKVEKFRKELLQARKFSQYGNKILPLD